MDETKIRKERKTKYWPFKTSILLSYLLFLFSFVKFKVKILKFSIIVPEALRKWKKPTTAFVKME